jgi:hypothetical protein
MLRGKKNNPVDKYAVSVMKDDNIVGYVPRKISKTAAFFLKHGGDIAVYCDRKTSMVRGFGHKRTRNSVCYDFFWTITTY